MRLYYRKLIANLLFFCDTAKTTFSLVKRTRVSENS